MPSKPMKTRADAKRASAREAPPDPNASEARPSLTKLDRMVGVLRDPGGASIADLVSATGWQPHSVRGALAGALKKKGHAVVSEKIDGIRRYRIGAKR